MFTKNCISSLFFKELICKTPLSVDSIIPLTFPVGSINAEIPLLADRAKFLPSSIDLKIECEKCWRGPTFVPNQPSSDILTIKLNFFTFIKIA